MRRVNTISIGCRTLSYMYEKVFANAPIYHCKNMNVCLCDFAEIVPYTSCL